MPRTIVGGPAVPAAGSPALAVYRKRACRLMRVLNLTVLYPKDNLSSPHPDHKVYPYLLKDVVVDHPN